MSTPPKGMARGSASDLGALLRAHMDDRASSWSIGGYGAIAEFHWLPTDRPRRQRDDLQVVTDAGALSLELRDDVLPHPYLSVSRHPDRWLQGMALCLPWRRARREARTVLTELGADDDAVRSRDREAVVFDLGLALPHVDACVRSDSPPLLRALRAACGHPLLAPGNTVMAAIKEANPHRVFLSQLGRLEVYQPIGRAGQRPPTPLGPHTHVLPRLLATKRANAEDNDAPAYYRACAYLYPKHPLVDNLGRRKAYDSEAHAAFTTVLERWGDPRFLAERQRAMQAIRAGEDPRSYQAPGDANGRHAMRIAIRELAQQLGTNDVIQAWRSRFDRVRAPEHPHLVH